MFGASSRHVLMLQDSINLQHPRYVYGSFVWRELCAIYHIRSAGYFMSLAIRHSCDYNSSALGHATNFPPQTVLVGLSLPYLLQEATNTLKGLFLLRHPVRVCAMRISFFVSRVVFPLLRTPTCLLASGKFRGLSLARGFESILAQSPPHVFVSSFNEWIGGRQQV